MTYVVDQLITDEFDLLYASGDPITGADLVDDFPIKLAYLTSNIAHTVPVILAESTGALAGLGKYTFAFTPDVVSGNWAGLLVYQHGITRRFTSTYQVISVDQALIAVSLVGADVTLVSPLNADATALRLIQGDSYAAAQSRQLVWSLTGQPDLTGASVTLTIIAGETVTTAASVANPSSGSPTITATLTKDETATLTQSRGVGHYDLSATIGSNEVTLARGRVYVTEDV